MPPESYYVTHFITLMKRKGRSNCDIARTLGVSEGTVRYRLKRQGKPDLRHKKPSHLDRYRTVLEGWVEEYGDGSRRRPPLKQLYFSLRDHHGFAGSYDSVCHYIRRHFPDYYKLKSFTRIETPPGALMTVDWKESVPISFSHSRDKVRVNFLLFQLAFSRKTVILVFENRRLDSFLTGHLEAFNRFGGTPEVIRTDCLSTAVTRYKGADSTLNSSYARILREHGIEAFPSRPRSPRDKGKVERQIRSVMDRVYLRKKTFRDLSELQEHIDRALAGLEQEQRSGASGCSVSESFSLERKHLGPLKRLDIELPLVERLATVRRDGTVTFQNNSYQVERRFIGRSVLCVQTRLRIKIYFRNQVIVDQPYLPGCRGMIVLSEKALRDPGIHISSWTREQALKVAQRQIDIYEEISNGGY